MLTITRLNGGTAMLTTANMLLHFVFHHLPLFM